MSAAKALSTRSRLKLRDLLDNPDLQINTWSLPDPAQSYHATAVNYGHHAGQAMIHCAQTLNTGVPMSAVSVAMPIPSIADGFLPSLGDIRDRLDRLRSAGQLVDIEPLDLSLLERLRTGESYIQKAAQNIRASVGEHLSYLDFYKIPGIPRARIEAAPNELLEIEGTIRVTMGVSLFDALVRSMEAIEGYEPKEEDNEDQDRC